MGECGSRPVRQPRSSAFDQGNRAARPLAPGSVARGSRRRRHRRGLVDRRGRPHAETRTAPRRLAGPAESAGVAARSRLRRLRRRVGRQPAPTKPAARSRAAAARRGWCLRTARRKLNDLAVGAPGGLLLADHLTHLGRQLGIGLGDGLVVADHAAQLAGDATHVGLAALTGSRRRPGQPEGNERCRRDHRPPRASPSRGGRTLNAEEHHCLA